MYDDYRYSDMNKDFAAFMCKVHGALVTIVEDTQNRSDNINSYLEYWNECRCIF